MLLYKQNNKNNSSEVSQEKDIDVMNAVWNMVRLERYTFH